MGNKGIRESEWHVLNRCMNILLRLMRGRATTEELLSIIRDTVGDERPLTDKALRRLFEEDKERLKYTFNVDMQYDRSQGDYELIHIGRSLVDLSEDAVRGLAFLQQTFSDDSVPMALDVRAYLNTVSMLLPYERVKDVEHQRRSLLEMELRARDTDNIQDDVWEAVENSKAKHQQLEFDYVSPQQADGVPRRKTVEPIRHFFDAVHKHYYLEAVTLKSYAPHKRDWDPKLAVVRYRLDRMSNPKILPMHFNPNRHIPTKELIYELNANVARLGVTDRFPDMQVFPNDDGSAKVIVKSRDLFSDLRTLLYYGANCRVIGGDDALYEMKRIVKDLASVYEEDSE